MWSYPVVIAIRITGVWLMMLGAVQAQSRINQAFKDFYSQINSPKTTASILELETQLKQQIVSLVKATSDPQNLSFDTPIDMDDKTSITPLGLLSRLQLLSTIETLKELQISHRFAFTILPSDKPSQFIRVDPKDDKLLKDKSGMAYVSTRPLKGRGQPGIAGFYKDINNKEVLIKQDDVGTCLLEGTAYFAKSAQLLPLHLEDAVNYATVASISDEKSSKAASLQDGVQAQEPEGKVRSWDELVYGVKRDPGSWVSYEAMYSSYVKRGIAELNAQAQWQLAAAVFSSTVVGDESLHVGQFMAILDKDNIITSVKRIDLGARERAAVARDEKKETDSNPYHASSFYQSNIWKLKFGQAGKDYIDYILREPAINRKFTMLWVNLAARYPDEKLKTLIQTHSRQVFLKQFDNIPPDLKEQALEKVLATINKEARTPFTLPKGTTNERAVVLANKMAELDSNRVITMKNKAVQTFQENNSAFDREFKKYIEPKYHSVLDDANKLRKDLLEGKDEKLTDENLLKTLRIIDANVLELINKLKDNPKNKNDYQQLKIFSQVAIDLLETKQLALMHDKTKSEAIKEIDLQIRKYQTICDFSSYGYTTDSTNKFPYIASILSHAMSDTNEALVNYLKKDRTLITTLAEHTKTLSYSTSGLTSWQSAGYQLMRNTLRRYGISETLMNQTPSQKSLLDEVKAKNFTNVKNMIAHSAFNFVDALAQDENGATTLHYLLRDANNDDAMEAITLILQKSIGVKSNSNLDVQDAWGKTPLDRLLENKNAPHIIAAINEKQIKGYGGYLSGSYQFEHFFKISTYNPVVQDKVKELTPQAKASALKWA